MVENRPFAQFMAYLTLVIGVVVVAFPVYLAIMASTFDTGQWPAGSVFIRQFGLARPAQRRRAVS